MDEKELRKFAGLKEAQQLDERFNPRSLWSAMEQLVADGKRDKKFMQSAISLAADEFGEKGAQNALDFLDLVNQVWEENQ